MGITKEEAAETLRKNGLRTHCAQTIMRTAEDKAALAQTALSLVSNIRHSDEQAASATSSPPADDRP